MFAVADALPQGRERRSGVSNGGSRLPFALLGSFKSTHISEILLTANGALVGNQVLDRDDRHT